MKLKFRFLFVPVCMVIAVLCVFSACSSETKTDSDTHKHVWNEGKIITQATCTTAGETEYACTVEGCTQTRTEIVIALGHDKISHEAVEPTCTEKGHSAYVTCSRCEYSTYQEIPALNHDEIPHGAVEPTCTEKGHNAYVSCSRCEYSTYQEIPALNHDLKNYPAQDPTCTADGWTAYEKCERNGCNYSTKTVIPTTGHSHELTASLKPTCLQNGSKTFYCDACGDTYTETVQKLGHDIQYHAGKPATCTEDGYKSYYTCSRCNYTTYESVTALGHTINANGYCTNCKTQIETYICEIVTMPTLSTVYAGAKPTISGGVVKANGQTVTGVWSIESTASASVVTGSTLTLTSTETFLLTFTPSNTAIYKPVSAEVALTFHAVAQYNGLYYSTLDGALAAANAKNSGTVTALPSTYQTETSAAIQKAKTISSVTEIRSGVTLALPWAGSGVDTSSYSRSEKANVKDVTLLALSLYNGGFAFKGKNLVNQVWIDCNLTNNGTITIGGMIAAQSSAPASCISTEKYAQITLCADAVLTKRDPWRELSFRTYLQGKCEGNHPSRVGWSGSCR
ncbi:MAG: hypothetical protein IIX01_02870 [Clostridia bacterium]|nr:hypothetical protein [Clostridia bacterium]